MAEIRRCNTRGSFDFVKILLSEAEEMMSSLRTVSALDKTGALRSTLSAAMQSSIRRGFERRDADALSKRFDTWSNGKGFIHGAQLQACLAEIGVHCGGFDELLSSVDLNNDGKIDLREFRRFLVYRRSAAAMWVDCIPLADVVADALSAVVEDQENPLKELGMLSDETASLVFDTALPAIRSLFIDAVKLLRKSNEDLEELGNTESRASKFEVSLLSTGDVEDFHKGLVGRIGPMNLNFEVVVKFEHCCEKASKFEFKTPNYLITTNSDLEMRLVEARRGKTEAEWMQILREKFVNVGLGTEHHGRRIPDVDVLMKLPIVMEAMLKPMEVAVLVLYTGPMYFLYNTELRRFPAELHERMKESGVIFVTTIHVLVSAVLKICKNIRVPEGTVLYRGLRGKGLPMSYHKADNKGRKGFTEWGFISTSTERQVAVQYSGVKSGSRHAVVLVIRTGAVDRGACIQELSQYEGEAEYLWLPLSLVEPDGEPRLETSPHGPILVFPVRIVPNLKAATVEENMSRKKDIHLTAFRYNLAETREQLNEFIRRPEAVEHFCNDKFKNFQGNHTLETFVNVIIRQFEAVVDRHMDLNVDEYIKDDMYRRQVMEMLRTKTNALSLFRLYMEDKTQNIFVIRGKSLLQAHRALIALHRRDLACAQSEDEIFRTATEVCRLRGLIQLAVDEKNDQGEPVGVSAAADGVGRADLRVLIQAGAFQDAEVAEEALRKAAEYGHLDSLEILLDDVKIDVDAANQQGCTALMLTASNGHERVIVRLLESKADVKAVDKHGFTALLLASQDGHEGAILRLLEGKADVNSTMFGWTPLMFAGMNGHEGVVARLLEGKADANAASVEGRTALIPASQYCHAGVISRLLEGKAEVNAAEQDGRTALLASVYRTGGKGHNAAVMRLLEGKADVNAANKCGRTALHVAAHSGFLGALQALLAASADPAASMQAGDTPLCLAASTGRWDCASALLGALGGDSCHGMVRADHEARKQAAVVALARIDAVGWTAVHYALAAADVSAPAAGWLSAVQQVLGGNDSQLLDTARDDVAVAKAAKVGFGAGWPQRWRGDKEAMVMVEGAVPAVVCFVELGTVRANHCCPAGARGYYELEIFHEQEILDCGLVYLFGFCGAGFPAVSGYSGSGVGGDGDSWAAEGARGNWWSGRDGGMVEAYGVRWKERDVIGLTCDLDGEGGRIMVGVNGDWSGAKSLVLPADVMGLLAAFSVKGATVRCNLAGPFRHPPPTPDYLPMASFPPLP